MSEIGFRAAFSVQDYTNMEIKLDPEYVTLAIHVTDNFAVVKQIVEIVPCSETDFFEFAPIFEEDLTDFKEVKSRNGWYCPVENWKDMKIWGTYDSDYHQLLFIDLLPC